METHLVCITAMSQDVCVLDCTLKVSVPQPQNFWNVPTTFDLVFCLNNTFQMKKIWCLETKLWLFDQKLFFPMCPGICRNICLICPCVTDCYCCGKRNSNKFFLTTKLPFVQSHPILIGRLWTTLVVFIWQKCMHNEPVVSTFEKERL